MAKFTYKAIDAAGKEMSGVVEAESENAALTEIHRQGLYPTHVRKANIGDELILRWQDDRQRRQEEENRKQEESRKKHTRMQLVVAFRDGRRAYGVCFALNPRDSGFYLDCCTRDGVMTGKTLGVRFSDLKAVCYVKSFDGHFDKSRPYREVATEGGPVVVEFFDGELVEGAAMHPLNPDEPRFFLVPADKDSNNISMLVERAAARGVYTKEEYRAKRHAEAQAAGESPEASLSQEETLGDFHSEMRNYEAAYQQYVLAQKKFPQSLRLRKKLLYTQYNIGVQYIKRHDYVQALSWMEQVLKLAPTNAHAKKKVLQLRKIIQQSAQPKPEDPVGGSLGG